MKRRLKRMLAIILTFCMVFSLTSLTTFADDVVVTETTDFDVFMNLDPSLQLDSTVFKGKVEGYLDELIANAAEDKTYRINTSAVTIDPTDLTKWEVYDHYDTAWYADETSWKNSYTGRGNNNIPETWHYYGVTDRTNDINKGNKTIPDLINSTNGTWGIVASLREHIYTYEENGKPAMLFYGYYTDDIADFLYYPATATSTKKISFDVDATSVRTHSLENAGVLINCGVDSNGYMKGYLVLFKYTGGTGSSDTATGLESVTLYKINENITPEYIHGDKQSDSELGVTKFATQVKQEVLNKSFDAASGYGITHIDMEITSGGVTISQTPIGNGASGGTEEILKYSSLAETGYGGFGPYVGYEDRGHSCQNTSAYKFSNLEMSFAETAAGTSALEALQYSDFLADSQHRFFVNLTSNDQVNYAAAANDMDLAYLNQMQGENIILITDESVGYPETYLGENNKAYNNIGDVTDGNISSIYAGSDETEKMAAKVAWLIHNSAWTNNSGTSAVPASTAVAVPKVFESAEAGAQQVNKIKKEMIRGTSLEVSLNDSESVNGEGLSETWSLFDSTGTPVNTGFTINNDADTLTINKENVAAGVYTLKLQYTPSGSITKTIDGETTFEIISDTVAPTPSASAVNQKTYTTNITFVNTSSGEASSYTSDMVSYYYEVNTASNMAIPDANEFIPMPSGNALPGEGLKNLTQGTNYLHMFARDAAGNVGYEKKSFQVTGYVVTYEEGATDSTAIKIPGTTLRLKTNTNATPQNPGDSLVGWSTSPSGEAQYLPGGEYTVDEPITLYPVWKTVPTSTVTFNYNYPTGVEDEPAESTQNVATGYKATNVVPAEGTLIDATGNEYNFDGWYTDAGDTGERWVFAGNTVSDNITLYAHWVKKINISFDLNYGGVDGAPIDTAAPAIQKVEYSDTVTKPENPVVWTAASGDEYSFDGWYTAAGDKWNFMGNVATQDMTLYAHWTVTYNIKFDLNYPTGTKDGDKTTITPSTVPVIPGEKVNEPALSNDYKTIQVGDEITHEYVFTGWHTRSTGGDKWNFTVNTVDESRTLYAQWATTHNISFDLNYPDDVVAKDTPERTVTPPTMQQISHGGYISPVDIQNEWIDIDDNHYYFAGWYTATDEAGEIWQFTGRTVDNDMTLYAKWSQEQYYEVRFGDNLGVPENDYVTVPGEMHLLENAVLPNVDNASRINYIFDGWYKDKACHNPFDFSQTLGGNYANIGEEGVTLYAKWTAKYDDSTDVDIQTTELPEGTYKTFYSKYIEAKDATVNDDIRVYRNFELVDGTSLPEGLYLNDRTGEVYGIPVTTGAFTFNVRMLNDEDQWISEKQTITISIDRASMEIDGAEGSSKTYGNDNPVLSSSLLDISLTNGAIVNTDTDSGSVTLEYTYDIQKAAYSARAIDITTEEGLASMPDLGNNNNIDTVFRESDYYTDRFTMAVQRQEGEDAGKYKQYLNDGNITGDKKAHYAINIATLLSDTSAASDSTSAKYVFTIDQLNNVKYQAIVQYGTYKPGDIVMTAFWTKAVGDEVKELVTNVGIGVDDAIDSVVIGNLEASTAGKLKVGANPYPLSATTTNGAVEIGTATRNTTANYEAPQYLLTVTPKPVTITASAMNVAKGRTLTVNDLQGLIGFNGLIAKDKVGATIESLTIGNVEYTDFNAEAFTTALAELTATAGAKDITIGYTNTLSGADGNNYSMAASTIDTVLTVYEPALGGGGGGGAVVSEMYDINVGNINNGSISADKAKAAEGAKITLTVSADKGYNFKGITVKDQSGKVIPTQMGSNGTITFNMPAGAVNIQANFGATLALPTVTGVSRLLIVDDHIKYIKGYPSGEIKPNSNMTRAEATQMFYNLLLNKNVETSIGYKDVKGGAWYEKPVKTLSTLGVVKGYNDGSFKPNENITRAEFTAMAMRFAILVGGDRSFIDVGEKHWAHDYISSASSYGWINGYEDGTFLPNKNITRAEVVTMVNHMLYRIPDKSYIDSNANNMDRFSDLVNKSKWYYYEIQEAAIGHDHDMDYENAIETWK